MAMEKKSGKQRGGTLLGFIIGLVTGLAIAVVVALVISKSSAPLSNKQSRSDKIIEPSSSLVADPNKPLYGKQDAAKEAAKEFVKESSPKAETPTEQKPAAPEVKDPGKPTAVEKPQAEKPKAAAKEPVKEPVAKPAKADDKWIYYLQSGAYREQGDAENARARLALLGFEARVSEMASPSGTLYRVRLGPYGQVDAMNRVRAKLTEGGVDAVVVRSPK